MAKRPISLNRAIHRFRKSGRPENLKIKDSQFVNKKNAKLSIFPKIFRNRDFEIKPV